VRIQPSTATILALTGALLASAGPVLSQETAQPVTVTNFPQLQKIEGEVSVGGTIRHSALFRKLEVVVTPGSPREAPAQMVDGGWFSTDGFTAALLSLQGELRGTLGEAGQVGAVLVPREKAVTEVLEERGEILFPLEVSVSLTQPKNDLFSAQSHLAVAFPSYQIYFYNSTDKTAVVNLYVYLTH